MRGESGLRAELDQVRSDYRRLEARCQDAERARDQLRLQVRSFTYGGPVSAHVEDWLDHLETIHRIDIAALAVAIGQARRAHPAGQSLEPASSNTRTVLWCDHHRGDLADCPPGDLCRGTPVPVTSDKTGDTGTQNADTSDPADADLRDLAKAKGHLRSAARILHRLHHAYTPRPADAYVRTNTAVNDRGCSSCARLTITLSDGSKVPRWERIYRDGLCRWCYDWRRKTGKGVPPVDVLTAWHTTGRVRVPDTKAG